MGLTRFTEWTDSLDEQAGKTAPWVPGAVHEPHEKGRTDASLLWDDYAAWPPGVNPPREVEGKGALGRIARRLGKVDWTPNLHPRDDRGRFIEVGTRVGLDTGEWATVIRADDMDLIVRRDDGQRERVLTSQVVVNATDPRPVGDHTGDGATIDHVTTSMVEVASLDDSPPMPANLRVIAVANLERANAAFPSSPVARLRYDAAHAGPPEPFGLEGVLVGDDLTGLDDAVAALYEARLRALGQPVGDTVDLFEKDHGPFRAALADALRNGALAELDGAMALALTREHLGERITPRGDGTPGATAPAVAEAVAPTVRPLPGGAIVGVIRNPDLIAGAELLGPPQEEIPGQGELPGIAAQVPLARNAPDGWEPVRLSDWIDEQTALIREHPAMAEFGPAEVQRVIDQWVVDVGPAFGWQRADGTRVLFSGEALDLPLSERRAVVDAVDDLATLTGLTPQVMVSGIPFADEPGSYGLTLRGSNSVVINPNVLNPGLVIGTGNVKAPEGWDALHYVLVHELGHVHDDYDWRDHEALKPGSMEMLLGSGGGMSTYGLTSIREAYAEAFAEWVMNDGRTPSGPYATRIAAKFRFASRFPNVGTAGDQAAFVEEVMAHPNVVEAIDNMRSVAGDEEANNLADFILEGATIASQGKDLTVWDREWAQYHADYREEMLRREAAGEFTQGWRTALDPIEGLDRILVMHGLHQKVQQDKPRRDNLEVAALRVPAEPPQADAVEAAWNDVLTGDTSDADQVALHPERYQANRVSGFSLLRGQRETRFGADEDGNPITFEVTAPPKGSSWEDMEAQGYSVAYSPNSTPLTGGAWRVPGSERPIPYVWRMMDVAEFQQARERGYFQSDQRMNLADEGTVASDRSTGAFYLPPPDRPAVVVRFRVDPADGWKRDTDGYVKTPARVPFDRVDAVSREIPPRTDGMVQRVTAPRPYRLGRDEVLRDSATGEPLGRVGRGDGFWLALTLDRTDPVVLGTYPTQREAAEAVLAAAQADANVLYNGGGGESDPTPQEAPMSTPDPTDDMIRAVAFDAPNGGDAVEDAARAADAPDAEPETVVVEARPLPSVDIAAADLDDAIAAIDKANRRAERSGMTQRFGYTVDTWTETIPAERSASGLPEHVAMATITLDRPTIQHDGWTFIATLDWDSVEDQVVARVVPGETLGERPKARECDVCKSIRDRRDTYVVRGPNGEQKQVGSNCLTQFLGMKPSDLWALHYDPLADWVGRGDEWDPEGGGGGSRGPADYGTDDVLALTAAVVAERGWMSRSRAEAAHKVPTADLVRMVMAGPDRYTTDKDRFFIEDMRAKWPDYADEGVAIRNEAATMTGDSDYAMNLRAVASADLVSDRNLNLLVSAVAVRAARQERDAKAAAATSQHIGKVGERLKKQPARVVAERVMDGNYGPRTLLTFVTPEGNVIKWWGSGTFDVEVGEDVLLTGTIKGHGEFNGVPETEITRGKVEPSGDKAAEIAKAAADAKAAVAEKIVAVPDGAVAASEWDHGGEMAWRAIPPGTRVRVSAGGLTVPTGKTRRGTPETEWVPVYEWGTVGESRWHGSYTVTLDDGTVVPATTDESNRGGTTLVAFDPATVPDVVPVADGSEVRQPRGWLSPPVRESRDRLPVGTVVRVDTGDGYVNTTITDTDWAVTAYDKQVMGDGQVAVKDTWENHGRPTEAWWYPPPTRTDYNGGVEEDPHGKPDPGVPARRVTIGYEPVVFPEERWEGAEGKARREAGIDTLTVRDADTGEVLTLGTARVARVGGVNGSIDPTLWLAAEKPTGDHTTTRYWKPTYTTALDGDITAVYPPEPGDVPVPDGWTPVPAGWAPKPGQEIRYRTGNPDPEFSTGETYDVAPDEVRIKGTGNAGDAAVRLTDVVAVPVVDQDLLDAAALVEPERDAPDWLDRYRLAEMLRAAASASPRTREVAMRSIRDAAANLTLDPDAATALALLTVEGA